MMFIEMSQLWSSIPDDTIYKLYDRDMRLLIIIHGWSNSESFHVDAMNLNMTGRCIEQRLWQCCAALLLEHRIPVSGYTLIESMILAIVEELHDWLHNAHWADSFPGKLLTLSKQYQPYIVMESFIFSFDTFLSHEEMLREFIAELASLLDECL